MALLIFGVLGDDEEETFLDDAGMSLFLFFERRCALIGTEELPSAPLLQMCHRAIHRISIPVMASEKSRMVVVGQDSASI